MKKYYIFLYIIFFSLSCTPEKKSFQQTFFEFDTVITITIVDHKLNEQGFNRIIEDLNVEAKKYDLIFNIYNKKSEIYKLKNFNKDKFYDINNELYEVLQKSKKYYYLTDKAFDVTIGKITTLYNFNKDRIPTDNEIKKNLTFIGMNNVIFSNGRIKLLKNNIKIDLGGIAKGYIIDKFSEFIKKRGYNNFLVNIGGDMYASGKNKNNKKWVLGIQDPKDKDKIIKKIAVSDKAIVTSGDYERYVIRKNRKYHHIIDPVTGYPVWNNIISVTVISDKTIDADCLATAIFVLGVERSKKIIKKNFQDRIKYYIMTENKNRLLLINN